MEENDNRNSASGSIGSVKSCVGLASEEDVQKNAAIELMELQEQLEKAVQGKRELEENMKTLEVNIKNIQKRIKTCELFRGRYEKQSLLRSLFKKNNIKKT